MESIRQDQLDLWQISDIFRIFEHIQDHPLDSSLRADGHKNRSGQGDAIERDLSYSGRSALFEYLEFEFVHAEKIGINILFLYDYIHEMQPFEYEKGRIRNS